MFRGSLSGGTGVPPVRDQDRRDAGPTCNQTPSTGADMSSRKDVLMTSLHRAHRHPVIKAACDRLGAGGPCGTTLAAAGLEISVGVVLERARRQPVPQRPQVLADQVRVEPGQPFRLLLEVRGEL